MLALATCSYSTLILGSSILDLRRSLAEPVFVVNRSNTLPSRESYYLYSAVILLSIRAEALHTRRGLIGLN